jgi:hypothetical protein
VAAISAPVYTGPYTANGTQKAFPFTFSIVAAGDIAVFVNDVVAPSASYSVAFSTTGGTVTFTTAPLAGLQVLLASAPDFLQASDFENEGA